jgi:hypothetical protein
MPEGGCLVPGCPQVLECCEPSDSENCGPEPSWPASDAGTFPGHVDVVWERRQGLGYELPRNANS